MSVFNSDPAALIAGGPAAVKELMFRVEPGEQPANQAINWLGIAEAAAFEARSVLNLDWAEVAIAIYDRLAEKVDSPSRRESLSYSQMNLRAYLIVKVGAQTGHAVLDPQTVVHWFAGSTGMSVSDAVARAARWKELDIDSVRDLRRIKNRLGPIQLLKQAQRLPAGVDALVDPWLEIRPRLP